MGNTTEAGEALTVLARFIERQAGECLKETAGDQAVAAMAAECCTTPDVFCRAVEIGTVISALLDRLDWPNETKLACREVLAGMGQRYMTWMMRVRARSGRLN